MYHGIIVEKSLMGGVSSEDLFKVINFVVDQDSDWVIKLVELDSKNILKKIEELQDVMDDGAWYNHFYDDKDNLIVAFKNRVFKVNKNKDSWNEIIEYGLSLDIPSEQLDFRPLNFLDEEEYFNN